jgi:recombination endonuclease VII
MKRCSSCRQWKPLIEFPRNRRSKDGFHCYCKPCHNRIGREYKTRRYGGNRHYHWLQRYGVTAAQVDRLIDAQGGVCAICRRPRPEHVDHDHVSGKVRGVLCFNCNGGLGQFGDDEEWLAAAIEYLTRDDDLTALTHERARALIA